MPIIDRHGIVGRVGRSAGEGGRQAGPAGASPSEHPDQSHFPLPPLALFIEPAGGIVKSGGPSKKSFSPGFQIRFAFSNFVFLPD
jgi:hypothetical protein